jgi:quinol monooxygenase YgiN
MIKHIVTFRLKKDTPSERREEVLEQLKKALEALPGKIKEIAAYEVGTNIAHSPAAHDLVLVSGFKSPEDLEAYRVHPEHQKVVELIKKTTSDRVVVDYEI